MPGPLHGVRVVDFSAVVSGPFAAMWLADQGADVIKIESPPAGDITRGRGGPDHHGLNGLYVNCNRGKRALSVDVTTAEGRAILLDLCRSADVFIQNWRPGVVERLGLAYDDVAAVAPDIIYVSISGYGPDGPYAQRRVYDPIIQSLSGHTAVQINPEIPFPDLVRTIVTDKATSLTAAQSICAALYAREKGAGGQHIVLPMLDTAIAFFFPDGYMSKGLLDDPANRNPTLAQTYRLTRTADGNIVYFCASDAEFHALFRSLDHPEWVTDPRYCGPAQRLANIHELGAAIVEAFETFTTADIYARMVAEEVPCGPVLDLDEIPDDPQVINNGSMRVREHPVIGRVREANQPVRYGTTPTEITPLAPTQGQHSDEILTELGRTPEQIAALRASGIVTGAVTAR